MGINAVFYTQTLLDGGKLDGLNYTPTTLETNFAPTPPNNTNTFQTYNTTPADTK